MTHSRTNLKPQETVNNPVSAGVKSPIFSSLCLVCIGAVYCVLSCFSHVQLFATPWTVAHLAPLSVGFSRQEHWSGLLYPSPGDLPHPGIKPRFPALQQILYHLGHQRISSVQFSHRVVSDSLQPHESQYARPPYWRRQWHPTPVLLPGKSHGRRSLVGCSPWGRYESDTTERLHFDFSLSCTGKENGNPLQCSCLENSRDREA